MPLGTVAFWRNEKGYGRIVGDHGEEFFVHFSGVATSGERGVGEAELQEGQRVAFSISHYVAADDDEDYPDDTVRRCAENVRPP